MTQARKPYVRPIDFKSRRVDLTHGSGGRAMAQLIEELFEKEFDNSLLSQRNDQAVFEVPGGRMAMTTDGFVISPHFFRAEISVRWPCTGPSTTWPWPGPNRFILRWG